MDKSHKYLQRHQWAKISPYLQEKMIYVGQLTNYQEGVCLIEKFYGLTLSQTQHFRLTNHYGALSSTILEEERPTATVSADETVYVPCDGSMILTREMPEGQTSGCWQEVKLCRVYLSSEHYQSENRTWLNSSQYIAHLGGHKDFEKKAEHLVDPYEHLSERLVFISDGASWIHKWQKTTYPKATQILDFYHVCEHLAAFAKTAISDHAQRKKWLDDRKTELLDSNYKAVSENIKNVAEGKSKTVQREKEKLLNYYQKNKERMDYKGFRQRGLNIGSGAIEAAHRNVIQKRMKQSGQRWTCDKAQNVLNLRTCFMSNKWNRVVELIRKSAA